MGEQIRDLVKPLLAFCGDHSRFLKKRQKNGGVNRNRTDLSDFADRRLTSWLSRLVMVYKITPFPAFVKSFFQKKAFFSHSS